MLFGRHKLVRPDSEAICVSSGVAGLIPFSFVMVPGPIFWAGAEPVQFPFRRLANSAFWRTFGGVPGVFSPY